MGGKKRKLDICVDDLWLVISNACFKRWLLWVFFLLFILSFYWKCFWTLCLQQMLEFCKGKKKWFRVELSIKSEHWRQSATSTEEIGVCPFFSPFFYPWARFIFSFRFNHFFKSVLLGIKTLHIFTLSLDLFIWQSTSCTNEKHNPAQTSQHFPFQEQ